MVDIYILFRSSTCVIDTGRIRHRNQPCVRLSCATKTDNKRLSTSDKELKLYVIFFYREAPSSPIMKFEDYIACRKYGRLENWRETS